MTKIFCLFATGYESACIQAYFYSEESAINQAKLLKAVISELRNPDSEYSSLRRSAYSKDTSDCISRVCIKYPDLLPSIELDLDNALIEGVGVSDVFVKELIIND